MLFPYCPSFRRRDVDPCKIAWNDPRRALYPNHAEFWLIEEPEHVRFERLARKFARRRRQIAFRRLLRRLFSVRGFGGPRRPERWSPDGAPRVLEQCRTIRVE